MSQTWYAIDFLGLMGHVEMEAAIARIVNLANAKQIPFARIQFTAADFEGEALEGFKELLEHEWIETYTDGKHSVGLGLVNRMRKHMQQYRERERFNAQKRKK